MPYSSPITGLPPAIDSNFTVPVETDDPVNEAMAIDKMAIQLLLSMRAADKDNTERISKEFFRKVLVRPDVTIKHRNAILLCLAEASSSDDFAKLAFEPAQQLVVMFNRSESVTAWHQHLKAITGRMREIVYAAEYEVERRTPTNPQWHAAARSRSWEHGSGFPATQWRFNDGHAENIASHGDDFLFFAVPLQGDVDVEADVANFEGKDAQMVAAGNWVSLSRGLDGVSFGTTQGTSGDRAIKQPLIDISDRKLVHYRARVRGNQLTAYFAGRQTYQQDIPSVTDPWVAVRSSPGHDGEVVDVRITGGTVPETLSLSEQGGLSGWFEYYQLPHRDEFVDWQQKTAASPETKLAVTEIIGDKDVRLPEGCNSESLLRYTRPMMEDGTIEFEFWYEPGEFMVHPALGQTSFQIGPDVLVVHRLTDGAYDQTDSRPDGGDIIETKSTLKPKAWNTIALVLRGDELQILLNQNHLHTHAVAPDSNRQFGLFHYKDQTTALVRNVKWTGDWPKVLPGVPEQSLAAKEPLLQSSDLAGTGKSASLKIDENYLSSSQFGIYRADPVKHFEATADGIMITLPNEGQYCEARLSPNFDIDGDFDITAEFDSLSGDSVDAIMAGISLEAAAKNEAEELDEEATLRMMFESSGHQFLQCTRSRLIEGKRNWLFFANQSNYASAGRLRLSRRGDQMLYQFAENDSDQFRVISRRDYHTGSLRGRSIRFGAQLNGDTGLIRSRWKTLEVTAEKLSGLALTDRNAKVAELNAARDKLTAQMAIDLGAKNFPDETFYRWGTVNPWAKDAGGLVIQHVGRKGWDSSGLAFLPSVTGDFDIAIEFDSIDLVTPDQDLDSQIFLQLELSNETRARVNSILGKEVANELVTQSQVRLVDDKGTENYINETHQDGKDIRRLRLVRQGEIIYCLVGTDELGTDTILKQTKQGDAPIRGSAIRVMVHSGGEGLTSKMRLKSWEIRAEEFGPIRARRTE